MGTNMHMHMQVLKWYTASPRGLAGEGTEDEALAPGESAMKEEDTQH